MQVIKPQTIVKEVVTKQGEVTINLVLDINVNSGNINIAAKESAEDDSFNWIIPEFGSEKIEFGKKVEE